MFFEEPKVEYVELDMSISTATTSGGGNCPDGKTFGGGGCTGSSANCNIAEAQ